MKIASYHRASTLDQDPSLARGELHAAAVRLGGDLVMTVEETGSGARNDRPGLQRVMDAARRGQIDHLVCWKLDRFGRSALDVLANLRELESAGVAFTAITQGITIKAGGDAMSRLLVTMLAAVAEFERDLIRERTILGLRKARAAGRRLGRPPASPVLLSAAADLVARGTSIRAAARAKGVKESTLRRHLAMRAA